MRSERKTEENEYVSLSFPVAYMTKLMLITGMGYVEEEKWTRKDADDVESLYDAYCGFKRLEGNTDASFISSRVFTNVPSTVHIDFDRTYFEYNSERRLFHPNPSRQDNYKKIDLSRQEIAALFLFYSCAGKKHLQRGALLSMNHVVVNWLVREIDFKDPISIGMSGSLNYRVVQVKRNKEDSTLLVLTTTDFLSFPRDNGEELGSCSSLYKVIQTKDGFTLSISQVEVLIKKNVWEESILPSAKKGLSKSKFTTQDIIYFVPFLFDKDFAELFKKKLSAHKTKIAEVLKYVNLCFNTSQDQATFRERHQSKILYALLIGFIIGGGCIFIGSLGWIMALSVAIGVVGGLGIGSKFDNERVRGPLWASFLKMELPMPAPSSVSLAQQWEKEVGRPRSPSPDSKDGRQHQPQLEGAHQREQKESPCLLASSFLFRSPPSSSSLVALAPKVREFHDRYRRDR